MLLYQLLTGRSPYRLLSYSQLQLERAICMDDPVRPSQMVVARLGAETRSDRAASPIAAGLSPPRLRARLSGDLDAIVAMAMRKEPDQRYPSVEALADDLNRHLSGETRAGTARRLALQHGEIHAPALLMVFSVTAAFLGLALIAGVTLVAEPSDRIGARGHCGRSVIERNRCRHSSWKCSRKPIRSMHRGTSPPPRTCSIAARRKSAVMLSLQPEVRAQLLESIGLAYRRQGLSERAIPLFEQAVDIRRGEHPIDNHRVAAALANLARALTDGGHLVSAEAYLQQALELSRNADKSSSSKLPISWCNLRNSR